MTTSVHVMNLGPGILRCRGVTLMESESETFAVWGNGSQLVVEEIKSHGGQLETQPIAPNSAGCPTSPAASPPEQPYAGKVWYDTEPPPAKNKLPSALQIGDHARIEGTVTGVHFENGKVIYVIETGTGQSYIADSCDVSCYGMPTA